MTFDRSAAIPRLLNLVVPGGGLIAVGALWRGMLIGLIFIALLNAIIVFGLIIPDAIPGASRTYGIGIGAAALAYIGAQIWLARILRRRGHGHDHTLRRKLLRDVVECLERGHGHAAVELLRPHESLAESDLLLAFRFAQALHAAAGLAHAPAELAHAPTGSACPTLTPAPATLAARSGDLERTPGGATVPSRAALRIAWQRVRRLDTHRIYRVEIESAIAEVELRSVGGE